MKHLKSISTKAIICYLLLSTVGCIEADGETNKGINYHIETIEDCEYIIFHGGYQNAAHKGNCKNPIHDCR